MPKLSQQLRDQRRAALIKKHSGKRAELRKVLRDPNASFEDKLAAHEGFGKLGRNSCSARLKRRCRVTGRARGYYRKVRMCRNQLRDLASQGLIPGMTKSSW